MPDGGASSNWILPILTVLSLTSIEIVYSTSASPVSVSTDVTFGVIFSFTSGSAAEAGTTVREKIIATVRSNAVIFFIITLPSLT